MWPAAVACACPTWPLRKRIQKKISGNLFAFPLRKRKRNKIFRLSFVIISVRMVALQLQFPFFCRMQLQEISETGGIPFREYCLGRENSLSSGANSVSSAQNSVSSLWHTNNRLGGTHWALCPELGEPEKTHWARCLKPYSPKPYLGPFPKNFPLRISQNCSAITVTWFNGFSKFKNVVISKRMVINPFSPSLLNLRGATSPPLVAPYRAILRDYLSDTPYCALWGPWCLNMTNWVRYPRAFFLSVSPLESMRWKGVSQRYLRDTVWKQGKWVRYPPSRFYLERVSCNMGCVSRTGPLSHPQNLRGRPAKDTLKQGVWTLLGESLRGNTIGATGPRASERQTCLWEGLWEGGFQRGFRGC